MTATDTGVGKTILCAALLAAMSADGEDVRAYKPAVTGLEDQAEITARGRWPADHELLAAVAGMEPDEVSPLRFGAAAAPHLAAQLEGRRIEPAQLLDAAHRLAGAQTRERTLIVEGVGGLLVPIAPGYDVRELARDLGLRIVIAARTGLGTINHTLLTLEAARSAGLDIAAVVLTPWPESPSAIERSNRETIAALGDVAVATLPPVAGATPEQLAAAGATLPLAQWLA